MLADAVGDRFMSRMCRYWGVATVHMQRGEVAEAIAEFRDICAEADASADVIHGLLARVGLAHVLTEVAQISEARSVAESAVEAAVGLGPSLEPWAYAPLAEAALAAGDLAAADAATEEVWPGSLPGLNWR